MTVRPALHLESLDRSQAQLLGPEWDELYASSDARGPFLTWPWIGSWLETLGADADLEFVAARNATSGELLGVAPFCVETHGRLGIRYRALRLVGNGPAAPDHLDLVVRSGPEAATVADALWSSVQSRTRWDVIDLDGVAGSGHLARLVQRRSGDSSDSIPAPYVRLDAGWEEVRSRFGRSHRQNLARYGRKLDAEAGGPVEEWMVATGAELEETLPVLMAMHQSRRTGLGDAGLFASGHLREFLHLAAHRFLESGRLRMWRLDISGQPAAVIWCVRSKDTVSFYTTGFDAGWSRYGPGRRIMARAMQAAAEEGATEFDMLRGDESYKRSWGAVLRSDRRMRRPATAKGRMLFAARSVTRIGRRDPA